MAKSKLIKASVDKQRLEDLEIELKYALADVSKFRDRWLRVSRQESKLRAIIKRFESVPKRAAISRKIKGSSTKHKGIAVIGSGDWHIAELVSKSAVNQLNEFNPTIAKRRIRRFEEGTVKLVNLHRRDIEIKDIVLHLAGDYITGYLHEELAQTNCMGPTEELFFAYEEKSRYIQTIYENLAPVKIRIVCTNGNHGRTTRKMQYKNDYHTSLESLLYWLLRKRFQDNKDITWFINDAAIKMTELTPGHWLRCAHGHQVKFQGGIGGLLVPVNRWVTKLNQTKKADLTMIGHFHSYYDMPQISVTASLKGTDEYSLQKGFPHAPPMQSFKLYDCKREMFTSSWPIVLE